MSQKKKAVKLHSDCYHNLQNSDANKKIYLDVDNGQVVDPVDLSKYNTEARCLIDV